MLKFVVYSGMSLYRSIDHFRKASGLDSPDEADGQAAWYDKNKVHVITSLETVTLISSTILDSNRESMVAQMLPASAGKLSDPATLMKQTGLKEFDL